MRRAYKAKEDKVDIELIMSQTTAKVSDLLQ
jgi:hypothetical protein